MALKCGQLICSTGSFVLVYQSGTWFSVPETGSGIPMGCIITEAIGVPIPPWISWGAEFQWGMGNPMGYWNSNDPIGIPRMDFIATQRSGAWSRLTESI